MNSQIDFSTVAKKSYFVASPMYGGQCAGVFASSFIDLMLMAYANRINVSSEFLYGQSLVTVARNDLVSKFLNSGADYMIFIDSDIEFRPESVYAMCELAIKNKDMEIVCGPYPKKEIKWEIVKQAFDKNLIKNSNDFENYLGRYVLNIIGDPSTISFSQPFEVREAGTGFMLISRSVFERIIEKYPERWYLAYETNEKKFAFFDCEVDQESKRYLSEDYMFCKYARSVDAKIWMVPWLKLNHYGNQLYSGDFTKLNNLESGEDLENIKQEILNRGLKEVLIEQVERYEKDNNVLLNDEEKESFAKNLLQKIGMM
jgi:hypothetical protein